MPYVAVDADVLRLLVLSLPASTARSLKPQLDIINFQITAALQPHGGIDAACVHASPVASILQQQEYSGDTTGAQGGTAWNNAWLAQPYATVHAPAPSAAPIVYQASVMLPSQPEAGPQGMAWTNPVSTQQGGWHHTSAATALETAISGLDDDADDAFDALLHQHIAAGSAVQVGFISDPSDGDMDVPGGKPATPQPTNASPSPPPACIQTAPSEALEDSSGDAAASLPPPALLAPEEAGLRGDIVVDDATRPVFRFSAVDVATFRTRIAALPGAVGPDPENTLRLTAALPSHPDHHPYAVVFAGVVAALQQSPRGIPTRELLKELRNVAADHQDADTREGARQLRNDYRTGVPINTFVSHIGTAVAIDTIRLRVRSSNATYDGIRLRDTKTPYHEVEQAPVPPIYVPDTNA
ncbi:hypothetical protein OC834_005834 [Tilletia horrida]|nr:hypothetical protein OC834_005834 [Tilletia horrida]